MGAAQWPLLSTPMRWGTVNTSAVLSLLKKQKHSRDTVRGTKCLLVRLSKGSAWRVIKWLLTILWKYEVTVAVPVHLVFSFVNIDFYQGNVLWLHCWVIAQISNTWKLFLSLSAVFPVSRLWAVVHFHPHETSAIEDMACRYTQL